MKCMRNGTPSLEKGLQGVRWTETELKAISVAVKLQEATASGGGTRQALAACLSAGIHCVLSVGGSAPRQEALQAQSSLVSHLSLHEELLDEAEKLLGRRIGIGELCKLLKQHDWSTLATNLSNQHRCRKLAAHPKCNLLEQLRTALGQICGPTSGSLATPTNDTVIDSLVGEWTSIDNPSIKVILLPSGVYVSFDPNFQMFSKIDRSDDLVTVNGYSLVEHTVDTLKWHMEKTEYCEGEDIIWQRRSSDNG